ncbi:MAG: type I glutamate--ammonia ligase [Myxococcales bacterium]|nr:type I glutamate--ammonia ligase [Myxococcales bacterium]
MSEIRTAKDAIEFGKKHGAIMADLRFVDMPGIWQHTSIPFERLDETAFEEGLFFDGSSVRGFQPINASDMLIVPDAASVKMDPFTRHPTLVVICDIVDPMTKEPYPRDPRYIAKKAEAYLKQTGIGDTVYMGPEAEFFVFDDIRYASSPSECFYAIDSSEAAWNTGSDEGPNLGHKIRHKGGYFPVMPVDTLMDLRTDMVLHLQELGFSVEVSHHEVATAGQCEIGMRFNTLTEMADQLLWFKYVVKNTAKAHGKTATFMPKPVYGDNGSGMHTHQSIWKGGKPLFVGDGYGGLSETALHYIGGILKHAKAINALSNATVNSYRRLVPGYEAPVNLAYSARNRSASVRIPISGASPKAKRIEVRFPDSASNPYLTFAAMLMAGIDGIQRKIDPGDPLDKDIYALSPEELKEVPTVAGSLAEALDALEADHEFLLQGDVFTKDNLDEWISFKRANEVDPMRLRPTPLEFELYYDV